MRPGSGYRDLDDGDGERHGPGSPQPGMSGVPIEVYSPREEGGSPLEGRRRGGIPRAMGMAFCSNFQWKSLFFQSLSKRRLFAVLYFLTGPFLLFLTLAIGSSHKADFNMSATIGVTLLMVVWWLFEVMPIGITSFIPVVLFPLMGVVSGNKISTVYFSDQILILFGSCIMAAVVEEYSLHRRLALTILRHTGNSPYRLVLGFLFVTAFLSMWLSNTATAAMMAPLASAVMETLTRKKTPRPPPVREGLEGEDDGQMRDIREALAAARGTGEAAGGGGQGERAGGLGPGTPSEGGRGGEEMVEVRFWSPEKDPDMGARGRQQEHDEDDDADGDRLTSRLRTISTESAASEYWCGIKIDVIQFSISVAICFGASLGGMSTLTGTGTNLVLNGVLESNFPNAVTISFGGFFCIAGPISFFCLASLWLYLCWRMRMESSVVPHDWGRWFQLALKNAMPNGYAPPGSSSLASAGDGASEGGEDNSAVNDFEDACRELPPMSFEEKLVICDFVLMAVLWFFRDPKGYPGWTSGLPKPGYVTDGTVAMLGALLLFVVPRKEFFQDLEAERLGRLHHRRPSLPAEGSAAFGVVPWEVVLRSMPWNVLFLVGGGLALSMAYKESNLSRAIASAFAGLATVPFPMIAGSVCLVTILISNFISNVATANIILPPLGCIAVHLHRHPLSLMLPATLAGSFSFISPIGTPANAIAYSMGHLTLQELAQVGSVLTVLSVVVLSLLFEPLFAWFVGGAVVPDWAKQGC